MSIYSFDMDDAIKYGQEGAIMLESIRAWIAKNEAIEIHFYEEKYWIYNFVDAFGRLFPFWTTGQIRRILENLIEKKAIMTRNFNGSSFLSLIRE